MKKVLSVAAIGAFVFCGASNALALTVTPPASSFAAEVGKVNQDYTVAVNFGTAVALKAGQKYIATITLPSGYIIKSLDAVGSNIGGEPATARTALGKNVLEVEATIGAADVSAPAACVIALQVTDTRGALKVPGTSVAADISLDDTVSIVRQKSLDSGSGIIAKSALSRSITIVEEVTTVDVKASPSMTKFLPSALATETLSLGGHITIATVATVDETGGAFSPGATDQIKLSITPKTGSFPALAATDPLFIDLNNNNAIDAGEGFTLSDDKTSASMKITTGTIVYTNFGYTIDGTSKLPMSAQYTLKAEYLVGGVDANAFSMGQGVISTWKFNGTALQAPIFQMPEGWLCRTTLTSTTGAPVHFTAETLSEDGAVISMAATEGDIPSSGNVTNMCEDWITAVSGGAKRGSMIFYVEESPDFINGNYQIVNPVSGSISNQTMIKN